ncbi:MAG: hypothetical protein HZB16_16600 [Armatimonadetes bacterium]|nr:hypothetical protein [Armatimonadota bacterium]
MDSTQRVEFPPPRRPLPILLWLGALGTVGMVARVTTWVLLGQCLPMSQGADLLYPGTAVDGLLIGAGLLCGCAVSALVRLLCRGLLQQPSRAEQVVLRLWLGVLALGVVAAFTLPGQAASAHRGAAGRFVEAMAPLISAIHRAENATGHPPATMDTVALHRPLLAALPRAGGLHVVYERQRSRLCYLDGLVFELDADGLVTSVSRQIDPDTEATRRWRGKSAAAVTQQLGKPDEQPVCFEAAWRLYVIEGDQALVYMPGHEVRDFEFAPWRWVDVCKDRLLEWDPDPERYR